MQEKTSNSAGLLERIQGLTTQCDEESGSDRQNDRRLEAPAANETVGVAFAAERFHLHALVQDAVSVLQRRASVKGLASGVDMAANCPRLVVGDEARVRQALMALIDASLQSTADGSIRLYVSVNDVSSPATVRFDVTDTSAGLKPAEQVALFEGSTETSGSDGLGFADGPGFADGLGLADARRLAEAMGGGVGCDSALGQGTLLWFTFEAVVADGTAQDTAQDMAQELGKAAAEEASNGAKQDKESGPRGELSGHVLVVEDNTVNRLLIGAYLEEFGLSYDTAETGTTALLCLAARAYDLVLMDVRLPDYSGLQMAERIRTLQAPSSQVPIVALTTRSDEENGQAFVEAGVNGCMTKPIQAGALHDAMSPFLRAQDGAADLAEAS